MKHVLSVFLAVCTGVVVTGCGLVADPVRFVLGTSTWAAEMFHWDGFLKLSVWAKDFCRMYPNPNTRSAASSSVWPNRVCPSFTCSTSGKLRGNTVCRLIPRHSPELWRPNGLTAADIRR